jgi:hypothetical protein
MPTLPTIGLGAPGIYPYPDVPMRALTGVRMDVCAFVGVAPRGPVRVPIIDEKWRDDVPCVEAARPRRRTVAVQVESFDEYRLLFGGFEGPGLLPYSVAAFFEQGGRRAYVARVVHDYGDGDAGPGNTGGVAEGEVPGAETSDGTLLRLTARDEGDWGNNLRASLSYTARPLAFESATTGGLVLPDDSEVSAGSALRLRLPGGVSVLRYVESLVREGREDRAGWQLRATFDDAASFVPDEAELVEGTLVVSDGDGRAERHTRLGLAAGHPRWIAYVLCYESRLVYPHASWIDSRLLLSSLSADTLVPTATDEPPSPQFAGGEDRFAEITPEDFFDASWTPGDEEAGSGVHALAQLADVSSLVVPDLYSPSPLVPAEAVVEVVSLAGPTFERCVDLEPAAEVQEQPFEELEGLRLDPRLPSDLAQITALQQRLVELADTLRTFVVLLDVPPGIGHRQILKWRAGFSSSYATAYHPWLTVSRRDDSRDALISVPPSAVAAGIIARQEAAFGVPHGPANVIAAGVVAAAEAVSPARHDELHQQAVNVYMRERDGVRLTAARTLSRDPEYVQLSVRRLMTMLRRVLEQKTQWIAFEPNNAALRREVRQLLGSYLRQLYRAGAMRGANEDEAFFVRCDEALNPPYVADSGQFIAHVGIAPASPLEFIVLRLARDGDGTLTVDE